MENTFLNYDNRTGLSTSTSRGFGFVVNSEEDFINCVMNEENCSIQTNDAKNYIQNCIDALEDGEFLSEYNWAQEDIEDLYYIFKSFLDKTKLTNKTLTL